MSERKEPIDPHFFTITAITFELLLIPLAWFIASVWEKSPVSTPEWQPVSALVAVAATLPLLVGLGLTLWSPLRDLKPMRQIRERLRGAFGETISRLQAWQILAVSLAAGFGEELLFRGALQARLGIAITAVLFGTLHWISFTYAILAGLMSAYLGFLFAATDNVLVPIIVHCLYDATALLLVRREFRKELGGVVGVESGDDGNGSNVVE